MGKYENLSDKELHEMLSKSQQLADQLLELHAEVERRERERRRQEALEQAEVLLAQADEHAARLRELNRQAVAALLEALRLRQEALQVHKQERDAIRQYVSILRGVDVRPARDVPTDDWAARLNIERAWKGEEPIEVVISEAERLQERFGG